MCERQGKCCMNFKGSIHPIYTYIGHHWTKLIVAIFAILGTTIMSGSSISLVVPLMDRVFVNQSFDGVVFDLEKDEAVLKGTYLEHVEKSFKQRVDHFVAQKSCKELLLWIAILLMTMLFLKGAFMFFKEYLMESISHQVVKDIRDDVYAHLHCLSLDYFHKQHVGHLMTRVTNDTAQVHHAVAEGWAMILFHTFNVFMYAAMALWLNWRLAIFALILFPLFVWPIIRIGSRIRRMSDQSQEKLGRMTSILQEGLTGVKEVKAFCSEKREVQKFTDETKRFYRMTLKIVKRHAVISPLMEVMVGVSIVFFLIVGGREVLSGGLTTGEFFLFIVVVGSLLQPFKRIGKAYGMIQQALASADRVFEIFKEQPRIREVAKPQPIVVFQSDIVFENIAVAYQEGDYVVHDIDFKVNKGQVIALVGPSGSGKTSLLNLLPRFYDPAEGRILIDGYNIKDYWLQDLRSLMGIVSQDVMMFHDTVMANIAYGSDDVDEQKVQSVAALAKASSFIEKMDKGYYTIIGDRGIRLSGGERQRLAIARALYQNPQILILDEATSALDIQTERMVQEAIDLLMEGRTVFVVAHRLATVQHADYILVFDNHHVVERGTHQELIERNGVYKKMYQMQVSHEKLSS